MKHYCFYLIVFFLLSTAPAFAQSAAQTDTTEKPKTSLTLATLYSSNVSYYGQTSVEKLPYVLGYAALRFPTGFWISGQTYKLLTSDPGISGLNLSVGYDFDLSKSLTGSLSYGRSFYPENSQLLQSANQDVASASLNYDWVWLSTGLGADYAFGDESILYTTFKASKVIDPGISFSSKDYLTLEPYVEIVGGNQRFSDTTWTQSPPNNGNNGPGGLLNGKGRGGGRITDILGNGNQGQKATVVSATSFDLLSYSFTLPLAYNRANYSIEASYQGSILSKAVSDSQKLQSFFNLGFYYTF